MVPVRGLDAKGTTCRCAFCLDYFSLSFVRSPHVECVKEAPQKNEKAQAQKIAQTAEIFTPPKLGWCHQTPEVAVTDGKKVRIQVRTVNGSYVGDFLIPAMRNRVSDAINEEQRLFISLTDVVINDKERTAFVAINKTLIESIIQL